MFYWTREPDLVLPGKFGNMDACAEDAFSPGRGGELKTLLDAFLENALALIGARAGVIRTLLPDEQTLKIISTVGLSGNEIDDEHFIELACEDCNKGAFRHGLCATTVGDCESRKILPGDQPFRAIVSIPLESRQHAGVLHGVFSLFFDHPQTTSGKSAQLACNFADQISALIEFVRTSRETRRAELLRERQAMANEIHDSLAQTLIFARMRTKLLQDAVRNSNELMATRHSRDINEALEMGQKAVRELITDFRSEMHPAGLLQALQELITQFRQRHDIKLECHFRLADLDLPLEHEIQAYNIVREALSNIARHSNASHARLMVDHRYNYYVFTIEDNGIGTFSPIEGHYGIVIMRERAQRIDGEIRVESQKGLGTCLQLFFPEPGPDWRTLDDG